MKYFAYGMNTNLDQMTVRCPNAVCLGSAWVDNYKLVFRTHADIEKSPGSVCHGVLWEITPDCLRSLDMLEGYPYYYSRFKIKIQTVAGTVKSLVYQMNDQNYVQEPGNSYLSMITEGYKQNGVPLTQIDIAINSLLCYSSTMTNVEYLRTQYVMNKDCV